MPAPRPPDSAADTDASGQSRRDVPYVIYARWPRPPFHRRHPVLVGGVAAVVAMVLGTTTLVVATDGTRAILSPAGVILFVAVCLAAAGAAAWRITRCLRPPVV